MLKIKVKSTGNKVQEHNVGNIKNFSHSEATHIIDNLIEQPEVKEKKVKTPPRKVVYITKRGSKAVFDSIALCAKIFGKDKTTIKYRIEHPNAKATLDFDWLEGGRLEYIND